MTTEEAIEERVADASPRTLRNYFVAVAAVWTLLILGLFLWSAKQDRERTDAVLLSQARPFFNQIIVTRLWNARHGGVYVPITKDNPPNPYLNVPNRDIEATNGMKLTLVNPAYMTRQLAELSMQEEKVAFHLTSDRLVRPANAPAAWEHKALQGFNKPGDEFYDRWQDGKGRRFFRYMAPVWLQKACLQCHAQHGFSVGDLRGGLSVTMPADTAIREENDELLFHGSAYAIIWLLGLLGMFFVSRDIGRRTHEQAVLITRLEHTLQGFLPICAGCKKIRDEKGEWQQPEVYLSNHSEAQFSHGMCPECNDRYYGEYLNGDEGDAEK